jgi:hypothetical protein
MGPKRNNNKGKKCAIGTDTTSTTNKRARVDSDAAGSKTLSDLGGTSNQLSHCATVATEEEDAASHGDDVEIEETHNSSVNESESESSEAELGELKA